jgi:carbonic anhydrase
MQFDSNSQRDKQEQGKMTHRKTGADGSRKRLFLRGFSRRSFLGRAGVLTAAGFIAGIMSPLLSSVTKGGIVQAQNIDVQVGPFTVKSSVVKEVLAANREYARTFTKGNLAIPPARKFAILTCMDARLDPAKYAGLSEGDAHVIRNAGGRVSNDAIRSLVISHKLLGTQEWFVIHHTNCGMEFFTDDIISQLLEKDLDTATLNADGTFTPAGTPGTGSTEGYYIKWLTIEKQEESVARDVRRIRTHPLVPGYIPIYGYIYDVKTGRLNEVPRATEIGRPI